MKNIIISQLASKVITSLIGVAFLPADLKSGLSGKITKAPDDFIPVLRFIACSDIHLNGEDNQEAAVRFRRLIKNMYSYASSDINYSELDAILVAGDFTGGGAEEEYQQFIKITEEHIKENTKLLCVLGNHEFINYRDIDASVGYDIYNKYISDEVDTDIIINGFHFIGVSYDKDGKEFKTKLKWLDEKLSAITMAEPFKPVFVYQHPHPFLSVYGSVIWGNFDLRKILNKYPQVVNFSGHSHYCPADPRSVWQGEFTAVGCGSLSAFMGNLNYIEGDKDAPGKSGGAWLCECDKNGNLRLRLYDIEHNRFFSNSDYYFSDLCSKKSRKYTWHQHKSLDTAPVFPENSVITASRNDNNDVVISFPEAKGYYSAENYKVAVFDNKSKIYENTVISEYVRAADTFVTVNIGNINSTDITIKIASYSPYAKKGQKLSAVIHI